MKGTRCPKCRARRFDFEETPECPACGYVPAKRSATAVCDEDPEFTEEMAKFDREMEEWERGGWTCPRCGSHETYQSNTPTKERGILVGIPVGETGMYAGRELGGGNSFRQVTRCKKCNEILTKDGNYRRSFAEIDEEDRREKKAKAELPPIAFAIGLVTLIFITGLTGGLVGTTPLFWVVLSVCSILGVILLCLIVHYWPDS